MEPRRGADSHLDIFNILRGEWSMWSMYEMTCGYLWWNDAFCEFKLINVKGCVRLIFPLMDVVNLIAFLNIGGNDLPSNISFYQSGHLLLSLRQYAACTPASMINSVMVYL